MRCEDEKELGAGQGGSRPELGRVRLGDCIAVSGPQKQYFSYLFDGNPR